MQKKLLYHPRKIAWGNPHSQILKSHFYFSDSFELFENYTKFLCLQICALVIWYNTA